MIWRWQWRQDVTMVVRDVRKMKPLKILQERQNSLYYCNCVMWFSLFLIGRFVPLQYMDILEDKRQLCIRKWGRGKLRP